jgi:anti-sigma B factor antagonist
MDLKLNWYRKDGHVVIEVMGEVDVYTAPRLRELFIDLVNSGEYKFIVNMEMLEFFDSAGLNVLMGGLKRARAHDGSLYVVCTSERILRIFRATGLSKVYPIFDTVEEALTVSPDD